MTYDEAAKELRDHYTVTGARDLTEAGYQLAHLDRYFKGRPLASIGTRDSEAYALRRQGQGASNGSSTASSRCSAGCCGWRTSTTGSPGCL